MLARDEVLRLGLSAAALADLRAGLLLGYVIDTGWLVEENATWQASVFAVMSLLLIPVLTLLMFQPRSIKLLGMVPFMAPPRMIGEVAALLMSGLLMSGQPLGFVAVLGVRALVGMIAKNAVILIEQIEAERRSGKPVRAAVVVVAFHGWTGAAVGGREIACLMRLLGFGSFGRNILYIRPLR